tara:strand:+ start:183 stop:533 length:351 start_codon:yes stop_codon:yes gene_type:complete
MRTFRKYEFGSKSAATTKINALPADHNHAIARLGNIVTTPETFDDDGNVLTAAVLSSNYHVDVLWDGDPVADWDNQMVWCKPIGVHTFGSSHAIAEWTEECKVQRPDLFPDPSDDD